MTKDNLDGAYPVTGGAHYGCTVDIDGVVRNEYELIGRYRDMILTRVWLKDDEVNETICVILMMYL